MGEVETSAIETVLAAFEPTTSYQQGLLARANDQLAALIQRVSPAPAAASEDEEVERVAQALMCADYSRAFRTEQTDPDHWWNRAEDYERERYRTLARHAIAALRSGVGKAGRADRG